MIYRLCDMIYGWHRMIYLLCKHDIISVPPYAEGIYHRTTVRYHIEDISPVPTGTDIIVKKPLLPWQTKEVFYMRKTS